MSALMCHRRSALPWTALLAALSWALVAGLSWGFWQLSLWGGLL